MKKIFLLSVIALITTFAKTNAQGDVTITAASTLCNNVDVVIHIKQPACGTEFKTNKINIAPGTGPTLYDISINGAYWPGGTVPAGVWTIEQVVVTNTCGLGISTGSSCGYSGYYNNAILYTGIGGCSPLTPNECFEYNSGTCTCTSGSYVYIDLNVAGSDISLNIY